MRKVILDAETDDIEFTKCWVVVCRDYDTDETATFRHIHEAKNAALLDEHLRQYDVVIGHNFLGFDALVLTAFNIKFPSQVVDTFIVSLLLNYEQKGGHSLDAWGKRFGIEKSPFNDFSKWSQELEDRCVGDTLLTKRLYNTLSKYIESSNWSASISLEHKAKTRCIELNENGFKFNITLAVQLEKEIQQKVDTLRVLLDEAFPPRAKLIKVITPSLTKKGTLHAKDFKWLSSSDLSAYTPEAPFSLFEYEPFNPSSPSQVVARLNEAGWKPTEKTKGHITAERNGDKLALEEYKRTGWKVCEENLETLPEDAPEAARKLAEYLLLASRLSNLKQWIGLYNGTTGRIHGIFLPIGSWTHRKAHQKPNMANIPSLTNRKGNVQPYGAEFRTLFGSPTGRTLVGTDAESIQLRIFAHLCNDRRLIEAIEKGKKEEKTDIHHLNLAVLDPICNSREVAKTYIYALLLGAGAAKQAEILSCTKHEALAGLKKMITFYPGWREFKDHQMKIDAQRGYFIGLDGRKVMFPSAHKILAGYLQNGESVVMKLACEKWHEELVRLRVPFLFVNDVHDEWQTETEPRFAETVGQIQAWSIKKVGEELGLNCALAGSYKIGKTWKDTH